MTPEEKLAVIQSYGKTEVYKRTGVISELHPWTFSITVSSSKFGAIISSSYDELDHIINQTFDTIRLRVSRMVVKIENG
jgi:hypothetical protein